MSEDSISTNEYSRKFIHPAQMGYNHGYEAGVQAERQRHLAQATTSKEAWEKWFERLGVTADSDVVNATATLVIEEREIERERIKNAVERLTFTAGYFEGKPYEALWKDDVLALLNKGEA